MMVRPFLPKTPEVNSPNCQAMLRQLNTLTHMLNGMKARIASEDYDRVNNLITTLSGKINGWVSPPSTNPPNRGKPMTEQNSQMRVALYVQLYGAVAQIFRDPRLSELQSDYINSEDIQSIDKLIFSGDFEEASNGIADLHKRIQDELKNMSDTNTRVGDAALRVELLRQVQTLRTTIYTDPKYGSVADDMMVKSEIDYITDIIHNNDPDDLSQASRSITTIYRKMAEDC